MAHVSHRLKGSFEGALAGGGDPASSPLYVFGPFLKLLVATGAGAVAFGTPIWMVAATVVVVSITYRHVMEWIPDGSGGSGLCEEEFGGWAVKINASITAIEYTLTFLVSLAALVTFVADRAGGLGRWPRSALAVGLSIVVGVVVNRGPRLAARVFGPATAAILLLLWVLVIAVLVERGVHLPELSTKAFSAAYLPATLGGYVRLLALMTGIEVFANLVAAYDGSPLARARKAFGSLVIVMVTTLVTMIVVGPAIRDLADPEREDVSVFTQAMDHLLPAPLAYAGTVVGIIVLLSAAAASAQGLQNLALGLRHRHYVPAAFGQRNRFDVADRPVILQVLVVVGCFIAFGTKEETYLALYAAGVFVLLGLTGWAAVKRLVREWRSGDGSVVSVVGTGAAALITSGAAALIFYERFLDGAWSYFAMIPAIYIVFTRYRKKLGPPSHVEERIGRALAERKSFAPSTTPGWPHGLLAITAPDHHGEAALLAGAHVARTLAAPWGICLVDEAPADDSDYGAFLASVFHPERGMVRAESVAAAGLRAHGAETDLVVVARELPGLLSIVHDARCPVLVVHAASPAAHRYPLLRHVLVALDGSGEAETVLPYVTRLLAAGARVELVAVPDGEATPETLSTYVESIATGLRRHGAVETFVGGSGPARTLIERAQETRVDLVVAASHGSAGAARAASIPLGSVPTTLVSSLACSFLIVPATKIALP